MAVRGKPFEPGNRFWEARSSHGRKPKFASPDDLWDACKEYFEWVELNPLWEAKAFAFQGEVTIEKLPKLRAMTVESLCMFLDVESRMWREWKVTRSDLLPIISRSEGVIRQQKFTGAAAELLNPNIIARDLGLSDRHEHTGADGGPIKTERTKRLEVTGVKPGADSDS